MCSLSLLVPSWGEARPLVTIPGSYATASPPTETPYELWKKADESLKIIEESLIAQGEPVENLSKSLDGLYQKSQELHQSVNALSLRLESLEVFLTNLEKYIMNEDKKRDVRIELVYPILFTCGILLYFTFAK